MSNLPDGVTDAMTDQGTMSPRKMREDELASAEIENDLDGGGQAILLGLIEAGALETYPQTVDEAGDAIDMVETFLHTLDQKGYTLHKKPNPEDPQPHDVWVNRENGLHVHIANVQSGQVHFQIVGIPEKTETCSVFYFKGHHTIVAPKRG